MHPQPEVSTLHLRLVYTIHVSIHWVIALQWKTPFVPVSQIKMRVNSIRCMKKIFHTLYNSMTHYDNKWDPWFEHGNVFR